MRTADEMRIRSGLATEGESNKIYEKMIRQINKDFDMTPKTNVFMVWSLDRKRSQSYIRATEMAIKELEKNGFKVTYEEETHGDFREPMDYGQSARLLIEWK